MGSIIDDRNIRHACHEVIIEAINQTVEFDRMAGHITNIDKSIMWSTCPDTRATLRSTTIEGMQIKVADSEQMVGYLITTRRAHKTNMITARTESGITRADQVSKLKLDCYQKAAAIATACVPTTPTGTQWVWPTRASSDRLTTAITNAIFGKRRKHRCKTIVLGLLHEPHKVHPTWATVYTLICDSRRYLMKDPSRPEQARRIHELYIDGNGKKAVGPINTLHRAAHELNAQLIANDREHCLTILFEDNTYFNINDSTHEKAWKRDLQFIIFRACTDFRSPDQEDTPQGRKDFADIEDVIDKFATTYIYNFKTRPAGALHKASVNYKTKTKLGPTPEI
jgi:hypothetical protein